MHKWVALLLACVALAGCGDSDPSTGDGETTGIDDDLVATKDTGIIRGIVVDAAIVPVEDVRITIKSAGVETRTNANGEFGFQGLEPGTYFLEAARPGYLPVQQSANVEAGVEKPPLVRILVERDLDFNPYSTMLYYKGFYQCGTSALVVCGAPGIILEAFGQEDPLDIDTSTNTFYFNSGLHFLQVEMAWESTQAVSPELSYQVEALDEGCRPVENLGDGEMAHAAGPSPLRTRVDNATLEHFQVNPDDCGAYLSVFAGGAQGTPVGFSVEQEFEWFISAFYGFAPPEDWWFIAEGPLPSPS